MIQYECCECGHVFCEDEALLSKPYGNGWDEPREQYVLCPVCNSDEIYWEDV